MGEAVKLVHGPCTGLTGTVSEISPGEISIDLPASPTQPPITILAERHHVRKNIQLYDFVEVVHGRHKGQFGFVMRYEVDAVQLSEEISVLWSPNWREYVITYIALCARS